MRISKISYAKVIRKPCYVDWCIIPQKQVCKRTYKFAALQYCNVYIQHGGGNCRPTERIITSLAVILAPRSRP